MRYLTPLLVLALIVSVILNAVVITRWRGRRAVFNVNGQSVTKADMDGYLEQQNGPNYKYMMTRRILIDQEAHAQGVAPTDGEIEEEFNNKKELDFQFAEQLTNAPWIADEYKNQIREQIEEQHLLAKDIPITDEELKEEYNANPALYDTPNKAHCEVAVILNDAHTEDIRRLMAQTTPPISPITIMQTYPREVLFIGDNNRFTFTQAFGKEGNADIFIMTPKEVKVLDAGPLQQMGARKLVVRLDDIAPGHRADLNDPKTLNKLKLNVALRRARPLPELLSTLWAKAKLDFEDPSDKVRVERLFFPDRARTEKTPAKQ